MCRETEGERLLGGTDIDTLTSVHPPSEKGVGVRSPKPPNKVLCLRVPSVNLDKLEQQRVLNEREGIGPIIPRKTSSQSPRLLPYFPKPGVTSPPPPQSLARNPDPPLKSSVHSPSASSKSSARNPSPAPASRTLTRNPCASPNAPFPSPIARGGARNPSPGPSSRATSSEASKVMTRNPSPGPPTRGIARNPSPTPAPRATARNPSPAPVSRASVQKPSPAPASRVPARCASPTPASSTKPESRTSGAANSPDVTPTSNTKTVPSMRRSPSPSLLRKDLSRSVSSDHGSTRNCFSESLLSGSADLTPPITLPSVRTSSKSGTADVNLLLPSRSLAKSFNKGAMVRCPLDSLTPIVKKLTPTELQAQKKERIAGYGRKVGTPKAGRVACEGMLPTSPVVIDTRKRCHWVTSQSEADLVNYHDEVWGVPVHDDKLLFELLVLEGAQAELSRPQILGLRDYFREALGGFDPQVVASFDEKKITALKHDEILRQPEAKLRGVIDNAKQILKIVDEFGSFDKYLWSFVAFKPIVNAPRLFTQIPVKSSKSESLSKDLMKRGFRYVGPTTVYSFMQAAGMVNDHLATCFRHSECCTIAQMEWMDSSHCDAGKKAC